MPDLFHMCAPCSELPSTISTMGKFNSNKMVAWTNTGNKNSDPEIYLNILD